jgi:hypothetical protein
MTRQCITILAIALVWLCWAPEGHANTKDKDWLLLESGGMKIYKRYGLAVGERLTMTLFPPVSYEPGYILRRFYKLIDEDLPRVGKVLDHYQTEVTEISGLSVITTLRRCQDHMGSNILVHYQAFYQSGKSRLWFVRTDLNDDMALLVRHYSDQLNIILKWIGMPNSEATPES